METIAQLAVAIGADIAGFEAGLGTIDARLQKTGASISGMGAQWTAMTAPMAGALGAAVYSAFNFEESMTNVGAVLGRNKQEMAALSQEILEIGSASRAGPQATAEAFYDIVGGVADASSHIAILNAAIATAEAGNANLGATTSAMISTMNSYGLAAGDAGMVSDVFTQMVGKGVGTADEFAASLPNATAMAAALGIEVDELGAMMAYLTTQGATASEASTQLTEAMGALTSPTKQVQDAIGELGYESGAAMIEALGLDGAYRALAENNDGTLMGLITNSGALKGALALSKDEAIDFGDNFVGEMTAAQQHTYDLIEATEGLDAANAYLEGLGIGYEGATEKARALQLESTAAQFDLLKSALQGVGIEIGAIFLPMLTDMAKDMIPIVQGVAGWARDNPTLARTIAMVAAGAVVLGPVLMVVGSAISAIGTIAAVAGGALAFLASPMVLVAGAAALLFLALTDLDKAKEIVGNLATAAGNALSSLGGMFEQYAPVVAEKANALWEGFKDKAPEIAAKLSTAIGLGIDLAGATIATYAPVVAAKISTLWESLREKAPDFAAKLGELVGQGIGLAGALIVANAPMMAEQLKGLWSTFIDKAPDMAAALKSVVEWGVFTAIPEINGLALDVAGSFLGGLVKGLQDSTGFQMPDILSTIFTMEPEQVMAKVNELFGIPLKQAINSLFSGDTQGAAEGGAEAAGNLFAGLANILDMLPALDTGKITAWVDNNIKVPFQNAIASMENAVKRGINDIIPDSITIDFGSVDLGHGVSFDFGSKTFGIGNPFPEARAMGGPVSAMSPYLVGERGPELFMPSSSGTIIPNHHLGGGGGGGSGITANGPFNFYGVQDVPSMYEALLRYDQGQARPAFVQ